MPALAKQLKQAATSPKRRPPVWQGPCGDGPQGGVTQGLIGRYLCCKERFRILVVEGLKANDRFNAPIEFGNMWHAMEEALAKGGNWIAVRDALDSQVERLSLKHPMQREEIGLWRQKANLLFPIYVEHWTQHPDVRDRTPLLQEQVFDVPWRLPSGRTVRLRGKWDSVDLIGKGKDARVYLQENKTKSELNPAKVQRQLRFDLQTMTYLIALQEGTVEYCERCNLLISKGHKPNIAGVRYNVVRRSAHKEKYVQEQLAEAARTSPKDWFDRWRVEIAAADVERFRRTCLDPVLENLCDDWEWWHYLAAEYDGRKPLDVWDWQHRYEHTFPNHRARHFRYPFGIYNPLDEGGGTDLDEHLETGSRVGLQEVDDLFPELKSA